MIAKFWSETRTQSIVMNAKSTTGETPVPETGPVFCSPFPAGFGNKTCETVPVTIRYTYACEHYTHFSEGWTGVAGRKNREPGSSRKSWPGLRRKNVHWHVPGVFASPVP